MSNYKLIGKKIIGGQEVLVNPVTAGGANVVLEDVPCEASVYVGSAVIMQASGIAKNGLADSIANSNILGIVEAKNDTELCNIRVLGVSLSIYTGLDVTKEYFLSATVAGEITTIIPTTSGNVILKLGQPFSATEFLMNKSDRTIRT